MVYYENKSEIISLECLEWAKYILCYSLACLFLPSVAAERYVVVDLMSANPQVICGCEPSVKH